MRGDRPSSAGTVARRNRAPPRARGSTYPRPPGTIRRAGSPACAGIDPSVKTASAWRSAAPPRARGDRPSSPGTGLDSWRAPPRARGSTPARVLFKALRRGSPACAGIDPQGCADRSIPRRLPRVRGDRPQMGNVQPDADKAPPRARGSTSRPSSPDWRATGSPACAGIDPTGSTCGSRRSRLPRVRGDRPAAGALLSTLSVAPPRARGSTRRGRPGGGRQGGSPACAGIDPPGRPLERRGCGLPRVRGDRPLSAWSAPVSGGAPPRARGSTVAQHPRLVRRGGSPACAGIDLNTRLRRWASPRLPRVRGDRPLQIIASGPSSMAPPRARGSTFSGRLAAEGCGGSPACAGIDRQRS